MVKYLKTKKVIFINLKKKISKKGYQKKRYNNKNKSRKIKK